MKDYEVFVSSLSAIEGDLTKRVDAYFQNYLEHGILKLPDVADLRDEKVFFYYYNSYSIIIEECIDLQVRCRVVSMSLYDMLEDPDLKTFGKKNYVKCMVKKVDSYRYDINQVRIVAYGRLKYLQELMYSNHGF